MVKEGEKALLFFFFELLVCTKLQVTGPFPTSACGVTLNLILLGLLP